MCEVKVFPAVWHPGVVDMDAVYEMKVSDNNDLPLDEKNFKFSANDERVRVEGNLITVPYSVRSSDRSLTVSVSDSNNHNIGSYEFEFLKFSEKPTLFDDFEFDSGLWKEGFYGPNKNGGVIKDSNMILTVDDISNGGKTAVLATIDTFSQSYGCFSSRIKMPSKASCNPAFWLCTYGCYKEHPDYIGVKDADINGGEIDIVEFFPGINTWAATVHWYGWRELHKESTERWEVDFNITDYNVYSIVWTETAIYWYLNEKLVRAYTGEGVTSGSAPMTVLLQLTPYYKDSWVGKYNPADFPVSVKYDWVKIHALK